MATLVESPSSKKQATIWESEVPPGAEDDRGNQSLAEILRIHSSLLRDLVEKSPMKDEGSDSSKQLQALEAIQRQLAAQSTPLQFIWNAILQTVLVAIAFLFGVFSIFSWHGQWAANIIAGEANQLALISICLSNNETLSTGPCASILEKSTEMLAYFATGSFGPTAASTPTPWPWPVSVGQDPTIVIIYVAVPLLSGIIGFFASWKIYHERDRSLHQETS